MTWNKGKYSSQTPRSDSRIQNVEISCFFPINLNKVRMNYQFSFLKKLKLYLYSQEVNLIVQQQNRPSTLINYRNKELTAQSYKTLFQCKPIDFSEFGWQQRCTELPWWIIRFKINTSFIWLWIAAFPECIMATSTLKGISGTPGQTKRRQYKEPLSQICLPSWLPWREDSLHGD